MKKKGRKRNVSEKNRTKVGSRLWVRKKERKKERNKRVNVKKKLNI